MVRFLVQSVERKGLKGRFRAGRFFPSTGPVLVIVHEKQEDPPDGRKPEERHNPPFNIGKASWNQILEDKSLRIRPEGDPLTMETAEVAEFKANAEKTFASMKEAHSFELKLAADQRATAEARATELEAELAQAYEKLATQQGELEQLRKEKAELELLATQVAEHETPAETPTAKQKGKGKSA